MNANLSLETSLSGAAMLAVAFLSLFGAVMARHSFRAQPFAPFAGLVAAQSVIAVYYFASAFALLLAPIWLLPFVGGEVTRLFFFSILSAYWLALPLFSPRFVSVANLRKPLRWPWLLSACVALSALAAFGFRESFLLMYDPPEPGTRALLRHVLGGTASGSLLVAAGFLTHRIWQHGHKFWLWLLAAALVMLFAVALQVFQAYTNLVLTALQALAVVFAILALLADRARFLQTESEVRRSLLESVAQKEDRLHKLTTALSHVSEAIVHVDLEERVTFANAGFARLAESTEEELRGRGLKEILPLSLYEALAPALQEARRERAALMEASCALAQEEKNLLVAHAPIFNENGKLRELHLGVQEATRYYAQAHSLAESVAVQSREVSMLQQCLDHASEAIAVFDAQQRIAYANAAFARSAGLARASLPQQHATQLREAPFYPWPEINKRLAQNLPWRGEVAGRGKDGRAFASDLEVLPLSENGERRFIWIERDLSALENRIAARTQTLESRLQQTTKLMEISENIRLNVSLEIIVQSVADAIHTLGWQRVAVFLASEQNAFELAASAGFDAKRLPARFRRLAHADFAPYLVEAFRLGSSFLIKSTLLDDKRPEFMPKELEVFRAGEWRAHDALLVPIRMREQFAGMIAVFCPDFERHPDQQQVRDLEVFADEAALAIQNSRMLAALAASERQARLLNQIGNAFRAVGTLERVLAEIAGVMAEALQQPVLLAMLAPRLATPNGANANTWLAASATPARKQSAEGRSLVLTPEREAVLQKLSEALAEAENKTLEWPREDVRQLLHAPETRGAPATCALRLHAMHSRDQRFGFAAWLAPVENKSENEEHTNFARALAEQATLTLDNTRLFLQTEDKARELQRANQHISEFLASVSHELRTPLHGILQFSEILQRGKLEEQQREHVQIVQRSGRNLLALINDILDLSKIEAGKLEAVWEEFELVPLLRETVDAIQPLCDQKALLLQRVFDPALPERMVSDRAMLARVLTNLLGNAAKFTDAGEIHVAARRRNGRLQITVKDSGIGMPAHRLKEIFEPFRQLESGEARKHGGTGLGLAISQRIMHILGGKIEVTSAPGKGSTFLITLPLQPQGVNFQPLAAKAKAPQAEIASPTSKKKAQKREALILVIDDDAATRRAMRYILEDEGYHVGFAENGEAALLAAQREPPDLILMDIMMPNLDGYQVARALKKQKHLKNVPLIALTARAMKGDREKALAAGCDDYLTKPFEMPDFLALLKKWLK